MKCLFEFYSSWTKTVRTQRERLTHSRRRDAACQRQLFLEQMEDGIKLSSEVI
jgi:hypothetical protein